MADVRINAGNFQSLVEIVKVVNSKDSKGATLKTRTTVYRVYGEVAEEALKEEEIRSNVKITRGIVVTSYALPIDTTFELKYKGRYFKITDISTPKIYMIIKGYE